VANTFLKPTVIASTALALLQREIVLPGLVWSDAVPNFAGAFGDTVTVRVPARTTARTRTLRDTSAGRNIITDTLTETGIDVKLDTDVYNAVPVTDEELTLDIRDFAAQILAPQVRAVAEGLENGLVACMQAGDYAAVATIDPAATYNSIVDIRKALNDANVPLGGRALVLGSALEAAVLKDPLFVKSNEAGTDSAMREAKIGRISGFDVFTSNALAPDEGYAFHRTAYVMATRAPAVPMGAAFGASVVDPAAGFALRFLRDYDFTTTTDRSLVDAYCGFKAVNDGASNKVVRAVKVELLSATITVTPTSVTKAAGQTQTLVVKGADGSVLPNKNVAFTTSDATKATVSSAGVITAVATGTATITATYQGHTATCAVTVS
jgi:hypothetical protein